MTSGISDLQGRLKPAVFLDRDGTITRLDGYLTSPSQLRLLPEAASSLTRLQQAGFLCILITNQSVVGRGMITVNELDAIHAELQRLLLAEGGQLDAIYSSFERPSLDDETIIEHEDRKPGPGMLFRAANELQIDLAASWMIGDRLSDVLAGVNAGCKSVRVRTGYRYTCPIRPIGHEYVCKYSIKEAVDFILAEKSSLERGTIAPQV
jgi:D-glycero-D-manno-heptose 1,7-bisphosphate phosphatase